MANWSNSRYARRTVGDPTIQAGINVIDTALNVVDDWETKVRNSEIQKETNNASVARIKGMDVFEQYKRDNANSPHLWNQKFSEIKKDISENILSETTYRESKVKISADNDLYFANYRRSLNAAVDVQIMENSDTDYRVGLEDLERNKNNTESWQAVDEIEEGRKYFTNAHKGGVSDLLTTNERDSAQASHARLKARQYILNTGEYADNPNQFFKDYDYDYRFDNDEIADLKREYNTAKKAAESQIKAELDLQARTIEKDIFKLQTSNVPGDKQKALELYNTPEAQELLSTSVLRTLNNGFDKTKDVDPVESLKGHAEATAAMTAYRAGTLPFPEGSSALEEIKRIVYEQVSLGHVEREDAESMIEELTGFKKSPTATSGTATAMDLGVKSINQIKGIAAETLKREGLNLKGEKVEPSEVLREIAKVNAYYNQMIIDADATVMAHPEWTPTQVNEHYESVQAPAKEKLAKDIVTNSGTWFDRWYPKWTTLGALKAITDIDLGNLGSGAAPPFGGPGRGRMIPKEKPEEIPRIKNDAEWEALPSGTVFIDPDGIERTK